jgi:hypothetical protein
MQVAEVVVLTPAVTHVVLVAQVAAVMAGALVVTQQQVLQTRVVEVAAVPLVLLVLEA